MPEAPQWARVRSDVNCHVRRGAWYEVLRLMPDEAVLSVSPDRILSVHRASLQIVPVRPRTWSIVPRPRDAVELPLSWGSKYAVCPTCSVRRPVRGQPAELQCPKCGGVFAVAWDDPF